MHKIKNEDEEGNEIPPPLFKKSPEDKDEGSRSPVSLAKMAAIRETARQQREVREISSSRIGGWQKPKQKDQTGQWSDRKNQDKGAAPQIKGSSGSVIRTTLSPHGTKPFRYAQNNDNEETQLLALGRTIAQNDKSGDEDETTGSVKSGENLEALLDNLDGEWTFTSKTSPLPPAGVDSDGGSFPVDYSSMDEEGSVEAFKDK